MYEDKLKMFRYENRIKQEELAQFLGLSVPYLSKIENSKATLSTDMLQKIYQNDRGWSTLSLQETAREALAKHNEEIQKSRESEPLYSAYEIKNLEQQVISLTSENNSLRKQVEWLQSIVEKYIQK